jgi:hypothetical protein
MSSGGWKARGLLFGKEDGYKKETLYPYIGFHKASALVSGADKTQAAWSNAAHATITGVGLLIVVKNKAVDVPLNIINLVYFQLISLTCSLMSPTLSSRAPVSP